MAKHALVVGSKTAGLEGPIGDAERMAAALDELGFKVDLRTTADDASRDGILKGYERLIQNIANKDDAAVFYYSGHGVRVQPSDDRAGSAPPGVPRTFQALVPTDFERSTADEFLGILDVELSVLLARLTDRTHNVTVILDCCHSAAMSRDGAMGRDVVRPKALLRPCHVDLESHLTRLQASGLATDRLAATGNPHAVRLVAAGQSESAYERYVDNVAVGTFTESLLLRMRDARGQRVTWDTLGRAVRERVLSIHATQRADIEGPRRRYLFKTEEAPSNGAVAILAGSQPRTGLLRAGHLHGVHKGDQYAVLPNATDDMARRIATATVTAAGTTESTASLQLVPPTAELPLGAQAVRIVSAAPRRAVQLVAEGAERDAITRAILATERFVLAGEDEDCTAILATVKLEGGMLQLLYPSGVPVVPASKWPGDSLDRLVTNLRMLTAAQSLRELESEPGQLPDTAIEVTWGRVENGDPRELLTSGETLSVGERLFVRITNQHPRKQKLYVSVFDIGVAQRIQLLTHAWPAGYELEHKESFTLGEDASGKLVGLKLGWSSAIPEDMVRAESLVLIVTERPCDLTAVETPGAKSLWRSGGATRGAPTERRLQQLVRQFQYGVTRDIGRDATEEIEGHLVRHIGFELSPWPLSHRNKGFLVDDSPAESMRIFTPRGLARASRKIAIRVTKVVVHDTRSWFGSADVRLDALVVTRSAAGVHPYRTETRKFEAINDGELLPLENVLIYHGDATDFVDLRIWLSRDCERSQTFTELLDREASSAEFKDAAAALLAVTAVSAVAPAVAAISGVATLTAIAWKVLSAALPKTIGLYQTSLLAGEGAGFGQGQHPARGMLRAQGFSFGYEVIAVD